MQDQEIAKLIDQEIKRQQEQLQLIPSENYVSKDVLEAVGSVVMNKYSEGYPGKRYYQGNTNLDAIEKLTQDRALKLFKLNDKAWHVNVQPFNGSLANLAVYSALLNPGDKIMGLYLYDGGHLSHGWRINENRPVSFTSRLFKSVFYHVNPQTEKFDYDAIEELAQKEKPQMLISGGTASPREIDYERLSKIAHQVGAFYLADVAHEAGLIAGGALTSPFDFADVVTMTTRKTLRGPIGAMIFCRENLADKIDSAVFPGLQGGPPNHQIAGVAVALGEALQPEFKAYTSQVVKNARTLAQNLQDKGFRLVSGGTDKHLMVVDLRPHRIDGWCTALGLEEAGIIVNRSTVPFDPGSPYYPSGMRLGTPAITTRGMKETEMIQIAEWIRGAVVRIVEVLPKDISHPDKEKRKQARAEFKALVRDDGELSQITQEVKSFCATFPLP